MLDPFVLADICGGSPAHYRDAEQITQLYQLDPNRAELELILIDVESDSGKSIGDRVLSGENTLPRSVIAMVFKEWSRRGEYEKIHNAFIAAGRAEGVEYTNDSLAEKARAKGLDEYSVCEQAAILEFEDGYPRWRAELIALGEDARIDDAV